MILFLSDGVSRLGLGLETHFCEFLSRSLRLQVSSRSRSRSFRSRDFEYCKEMVYQNFYNSNIFVCCICRYETTKTFRENARNLKKSKSEARASAKTFSRGWGKLDILLILPMLLTVQCQCTFTKRFALSTP